MPDDEKARCVSWERERGERGREKGREREGERESALHPASEAEL